MKYTASISAYLKTRTVRQVLGCLLVSVAIYGCSDEQGAVVAADPETLASVPSVLPQPQVPLTDPQPVEPQPPQPVVEPPAPIEQTPTAAPEPQLQGSYDLSMSLSNNNLTEGDTNGVSVTFNINRRDGHQSPINIVVDENGGNRQQSLSIELSNATLSGFENSASARIFLPIAIGPISAHQRRVTVTAQDGVNTSTNAFDINIQPVPAPDVYLLIGQSNMVGDSEFGAAQKGAGQLDEVNSRIDQLNVRPNSDTSFDTAEKFTDEGFNVLQPTFLIAEDPLHEARFQGRTDKGGSQIGPGLPFAKAQLPFTTQNIILVPAAWGATSFCRASNPLLGWNSVDLNDANFGNTLLLDRAVLRANVALRDSGGIFRGILWHQGESDSNDAPCSNLYESNLASMVNALRTRIRQDRRGASARGPNAPIPFIAGTMSRGDDERGEFSIFSAEKRLVDAAHRNLGNVVSFAGTAIADDLVPPAYPCGSNSCVHFGAAAMREFGYRYHQEIQRIIDANRR